MCIQANYKLHIHREEQQWS